MTRLSLTLAPMGISHFHWFQRRRFKCEKLTDGRTLTHDKSSHGLWPGELKKGNLKGLLYTFVCECVYVYVHISLFLPECACTTIIDISPRIFSLMYCCFVSIIIGFFCICPPGALIWLINLFLFLFHCPQAKVHLRDLFFVKYCISTVQLL
jgi:hypothetical protein